MPGHASVPGGLACTLVRGSGVSCQIAAAVGGTARARIARAHTARHEEDVVRLCPVVADLDHELADRPRVRRKDREPADEDGAGRRADRGTRREGPARARSGDRRDPAHELGRWRAGEHDADRPGRRAVPLVRRHARRRAGREPATGERTGTEVGRGRAHVVGSELAATGCLRRRAVAAPDPGCERERRHQNQRKQCAARARHDHHADLRGVAVASTRTSNASPPSRRSNVKRTSPRTVTVTDSRLLRTSTPRIAAVSS